MYGNDEDILASSDTLYGSFQCTCLFIICMEYLTITFVRIDIQISLATKTHTKINASYDKPKSKKNALGHSQCKTLSWNLRQLITYYLYYFADVAPYLLKKEVEKIRLQVHIVGV